MKKRNLLVIAVSLATVACKQSSTPTSKDNPPSESNASAIISYTNDVIDVLKKYNEAAEDASKYYVNLEDKWDGKSSFVMPSNKMAFLWTEKSKAAKAFAAPSSALGADQQFFKDSLAKYKTLFSNFQQQDSVLKLYVTAEDYKDDNYAKGKDIIAKQLAIYPQLVSLRSVIGSKIEVIGDAAEEVALKDSPIKDAYKAAKSDLKQFQNVADMIAEKETYSDAELTEIDNAYNALNSSIEKNKSIDKANLDKEQKTNSYNSLYNSLSTQTASLKTVVRNIKSSKKLTESDYNKVNSCYSSVVSSYNSWVN